MINYPSEDWIRKTMSTQKCTREIAEQIWWDNEIDHDRPTPFDLTEEQEKISKDMRKGKAVDAYGKTRTRQHKTNSSKVWIMSRVKTLLEGYAIKGELSDLTEENPERALSFVFCGKHYTLTLTEHRQPKKG